ncbi:tyrosine--tRNA ligase [Mycoplasmopsis edwardii]|nr:tyrosine--tRNA ligase [Mycoplasmopsis edwardii]
MEIIKDLTQRGILKDVTNLEKFQNIDKDAKIYSGFDPTAISLHLGNYIQILTLLRLKKAGIKTLAIVGGATGTIGDPTFRSTERIQLSNDEVNKNKMNIIKQLESFGIEVFDNLKFYENMNILDFLREVGSSINVAYMLNKDSIAKRLENGLSFTEFSYTIIQGWDFYELYKNHNVHGQFGGSDQWGNITSGLEIISKKVSQDHKAFAFTTNLLTDQNGNKFGKSTGGGNLWLDKNLTKPYDMYQFLLNQPDAEIEKLLNWLTFLSYDEIKKIMKDHENDPKLRIAQKALGYEVIKDIHGESEANKARSISKLLFDKNIDLDSMKIEEIEAIDNEIKTLELSGDLNLVEELISNKVIKSKREAREFIEKGSLKLNFEPISEDQKVNSKYFENKYALLHVGKKNVYIIKIKTNK